MRAFVACSLLVLVAALVAPVSANAQTDVDCVSVFDATGVRLGRAADGFDDNPEGVESVRIFMAHEGSLVQLNVYKHGFRRGGDRYFASADCTGDAYMLSSVIQPNANIIGIDVWYAVTTESPISLVYQSHWQSGICDVELPREITNVVPVKHFTLPAFTPPFHLEPEPCSPPPDPEQIINACVKNKGGAMRVVDGPADCTARETPISWLGQ